MRYLLIILSMIYLAACSSQVAKSKKTKLDGGALISSSEDQQLAFVKRHKSYLRICAETDNDFGTAHSSGIGLNFKGVGLSENSNVGEIALGGRSPSVLITRELMYRACEMSLNLNLSSEQAIEIYLKTLSAIPAIAGANSGAGTKVQSANVSSNVTIPSASTMQSSGDLQQKSTLSNTDDIIDGNDDIEIDNDIEDDSDSY